MARQLVSEFSVSNSVAYVAAKTHWKTNETLQFFSIDPPTSFRLCLCHWLARIYWWWIYRWNVFLSPRIGVNICTRSQARLSISRTEYTYLRKLARLQGKKLNMAVKSQNQPSENTIFRRLKLISTAVLLLYKTPFYTSVEKHTLQLRTITLRVSWNLHTRVWGPPFKPRKIILVGQFAAK